ncbi:MAG TPA: hypothetical protein VG965_01095 [Patescibacteria group bacterium]|nr:hypothetical protein [Patescibacteria group bacterium]
MKKGQALVTLLLFVVSAIIIISGAVVVIILNSKTNDKFYQGEISYDVAESGAENALIKLLRNPNYTGETLTMGSDTATITVASQSGVITITSKGKTGNFLRTIKVTASYNNNILSVTSWKEL